MAYAENALSFWRVKYRQEPDSLDFVGAFPDMSNDPTHYVFRIKWAAESTYVICEKQQGQLMIRECNDPQEIQSIEEMSASSNEPSGDSSEETDP